MVQAARRVGRALLAAAVAAAAGFLYLGALTAVWLLVGLPLTLAGVLSQDAAESPWAFIVPGVCLVLLALSLVPSYVKERRVRRAGLRVPIRPEPRCAEFAAAAEVRLTRRPGHRR